MKKRERWRGEVDKKVDNDCGKSGTCREEGRQKGRKVKRKVDKDWTGRNRRGRERGNEIHL